MKAIKCPNCGKRMIAIERGNAPTVAWMACALDGCGVRGPVAQGRTGTAAVRLAARLTREWIARMEADRSWAWIDGKTHGEKVAEQDRDYRFRLAVQSAYDKLIKVCDEVEYIDAVFGAIRSNTGIAPKGWEVTP
jgi:hypothetical protein